ncbi:hypothetical protein [Dipodfec virus UOA04_Rod_997]|nr:hypothetical protein [Dipodfec virus UOA04_Rod_997]
MKTRYSVNVYPRADADQIIAHYENIDLHEALKDVKRSFPLFWDQLFVTIFDYSTCTYAYRFQPLKSFWI